MWVQYGIKYEKLSKLVNGLVQSSVFMNLFSMWFTSHVVAHNIVSTRIHFIMRMW